MSYFLKTDTNPIIYFAPKKHNEKTLAMLESQLKYVEEKRLELEQFVKNNEAMFAFLKSRVTRQESNNPPSQDQLHENREKEEQNEKEEEPNEKEEEPNEKEQVEIDAPRIVQSESSPSKE